MITAKKYGRYGTRYQGNGIIFTLYQKDDALVARIEMGDGRLIPRHYTTRAEAMVEAAQWLDPCHRGVYIANNDLVLCGDLVGIEQVVSG